MAELGENVLVKCIIDKYLQSYDDILQIVA